MLLHPLSQIFCIDFIIFLVWLMLDNVTIAITYGTFPFVQKGKMTCVICTIILQLISNYLLLIKQMSIKYKKLKPGFLKWSVQTRV